LPTFTDDDLADASPEDIMRVALLVVANAALDLVYHIADHGGPLCIAIDARRIASMAAEAANGRLTEEHISLFKAILAENEIGEPAGHG
jgi:hypothetical protein